MFILLLLNGLMKYNSSIKSLCDLGDIYIKKWGNIMDGTAPTSGLNFSYMPDEIIEEITFWAGEDCFEDISLVCKKWHSIYKTPTANLFWKGFVCEGLPKCLTNDCQSNIEIVAKTRKMISKVCTPGFAINFRDQPMIFSGLIETLNGMQLSKEKYSFLKSYVNKFKPQGICFNAPHLLCKDLDYSHEITKPLKDLLELGLDPNTEIFSFPFLKHVFEYARKPDHAFKAAQLLIDFGAHTDFSVSKHKQTFTIFEFAKYFLYKNNKHGHRQIKKEVDALETRAKKT
jgi:hypothetical protein